MTTTGSNSPAAAAEMRGYRYKHGDRPLDGYTIQRAAGRGGFGEVYYAVSDSGREVALKVVQAFEDVELRGIGQCMNLKSPHLVTVFDVRHGTDGQPIVIMEYVAGPSLRDLLDEAPSGLGVQKAAFFLREIGKGLTYLHDCGIVHRDLKPANIFYENGTVKIGDYGLSKAITASHRSGQTMTVGTVHYMAPEVGAGRYDRSIDIYALGALLYEMLTGQPPFYGASAAEVLMKHLGTAVDVSPLPEPFATVVRRAMAKEPAQRYATVQEMVEAVFGAEHVRQSVSCFSPESLTLVAGRVAGRVDANPPPRPLSSHAYELRREGDWREEFQDWAARFRTRMRARFTPWKKRGAREGVGADQGSDPLPYGQRQQLATFVALLLAAAGTALAAGGPTRGLDAGWVPVFLALLFSIIGGAAGLHRASTSLMPALRTESRLLRHLAIGGSACTGLLFMFIFWGHHWRGFPHALPSCAAIAVALLVLDWQKRLRPDRRERLVPWQLLSAAGVGLLSALIFDGEVALVVATVCGIALTAGIQAPWVPPAARAVAEPLMPPIPPMPPMPWPFTSKQKQEAHMSSVAVPPAAAPATPPPASVWPHDDRRESHLVGTIVRLPVVFASGVFLLICLATAVFLAADVPGLLATGRLDARLPHDMARNFNTESWPSVMRAMGGAVLFVTGAVACAMQMLVRRRFGAAHMIRGLVGAVLLVAVPFIAMGGQPTWAHAGPPVFWEQHEDWWRVVQDGVGRATVQSAVAAACAFAGAMVLLMWPAGRARGRVVKEEAVAKA